MDVPLIQIMNLFEIWETKKSSLFLFYYSNQKYDILWREATNAQIDVVNVFKTYFPVLWFCFCSCVIVMSSFLLSGCCDDVVVEKFLWLFCCNYYYYVVAVVVVVIDDIALKFWL